MDNNKYIEVTWCDDCVFRVSDGWSSACYHPNEATNMNEVEYYRGENYSPEWCPLKISSLHISIKKD